MLSELTGPGGNHRTSAKWLLAGWPLLYPAVFGQGILGYGRVWRCGRDNTSLPYGGRIRGQIPMSAQIVGLVVVHLSPLAIEQLVKGGFVASVVVTVGFRIG